MASSASEWGSSTVNLQLCRLGQGKVKVLGLAAPLRGAMHGRRPIRNANQQDGRDDEPERPQLRQRQWSRDVRVDADELNQEPDHAGRREITGEYHAIGNMLAPPSQEQDAEDCERRRLVELRGMHWCGRRGQSLRERDGPWQCARLS